MIPKKSIVKWLIAAMAPLLLTGCGNWQRYPSGWGEVRSEDCTAILGTYENQPEDTPYYQFPLLDLIPLALGYQVKTAPNQAWVTLDIPESGVLEVRGSVDIERYEFACSGAGIELSHSFGQHGKLGAVFGHGNLTLARNNDGWLIVRREGEGFVLFGYTIPMFGRGRMWYGYKPVQEKAITSQRLRRDLLIGH